MDADLVKIVSQGGGMVAALLVLIWTVKNIKDSLDANTKALMALLIAFERAGIKVKEEKQ